MTLTATQFGTQGFGATATFTCKDGYGMCTKNGAGPVRTCGADSRWSGKQPRCARK